MLSPLACWCRLAFCFGLLWFLPFQSSGSQQTRQRISFGEGVTTYRILILKCLAWRYTLTLLLTKVSFKAVFLPTVSRGNEDKIDNLNSFRSFYTRQFPPKAQLSAGNHRSTPNNRSAIHPTVQLQCHIHWVLEKRSNPPFRLQQMAQFVLFVNDECVTEGHVKYPHVLQGGERRDGIHGDCGVALEEPQQGHMGQD
jgi:hypothetical protein